MDTIHQPVPAVRRVDDPIAVHKIRDPGMQETKILNSAPVQRQLDSPDYTLMDSAGYAKLLQKHGQTRNISQGRLVHEKLSEVGADRDCTFLGNNLIQMYGSCGCSDEARQVFDRLHHPNVFSFTIMISAYTQNSGDQQAILLFRCMDLEGVKPNSVTFINILTACSNLGDVQTGLQLHNRIVSEGLENYNVLSTALLVMYSKCDQVEEAKRVFNGLRERDVVSWTAIIAAHRQAGQPEQALQLFREMDVQGVRPNQSTFVNVLSVCTYMEAAGEGHSLYKRAVACGFGTDVVVGSTAVTMYSRCGMLADARAAFDRLQQKTTSSWNSMVRAYVQHGRVSDAVGLYERMTAQGGVADSFTRVCLLGVCKSLKEAEGIVQQVGALRDDVEPDDIVAPMVVSVYAKCGGLDQAMTAFTKMSSKNVVVWNALMAGYVQAEMGKEALEVYHKMNVEGLVPDMYTYSSVLGACCCSRSLTEGKALHARILSCGLDVVIPLQNGLVNMYAKCGSLQTATELFLAMKARSSISWNTMVTAFCQHGEVDGAFDLLKDLVLEGAEPHEQAFTSVLHLCAHSGLVDDGYEYFRMMVEDFGISAVDEHFRCMTDLLGRSGHVGAAELVVTFAFPDSVIAWSSLLAACRMHRNPDVGSRAAQQLVRLNHNSAPLIQLSNLFSEGQRDERGGEQPFGIQ